MLVFQPRDHGITHDSLIKIQMVPQLWCFCGITHNTLVVFPFWIIIKCNDVFHPRTLIIVLIQLSSGITRLLIWLQLTNTNNRGGNETTRYLLWL